MNNQDQVIYISLDKAKEAMRGLYEDDINNYGVAIPECFDYKRAIEALEMLTQKFNVEVYEGSEQARWRDGK